MPSKPTTNCGALFPNLVKCVQVLKVSTPSGMPNASAGQPAEKIRESQRSRVSNAPSNPRDERVLVVPSAAFDQLGRFQGFSPDADRYVEALLVPELVSFRPRSIVEDDPSYKQIIPYVVFRSGDQVFCYRRGDGSGEVRLRRKRSIGVGGHVDEADAQGPGLSTLDAYETAVRRELEEEVEIRSPGMISRFGLINDDATPVGRVHLGIVHLFRLETPNVVAREDGLVETGFLNLDDLAAIRDDLETWSQICLDALRTTLIPHAGQN